jgi:predicted nuclease of predicted toxin-antitoxin system
VKDAEIFQAARLAKAVVMTKDADFAELVGRLGSPPQVLWVTCGNTTDARLRQILSV